MIDLSPYEDLQEFCSYLFQQHNLGPIKSIKHIKEGFRHIIFDINNSYILKICGNKSFEQSFKNEIALNRYFADTLPVPSVVLHDYSKTILSRYFYLYSKIQGVSLYYLWHTLSLLEKEYIVKQIVEYLKTINTSNLKEILGLSTINWPEIRLSETYKALKKIGGRNLLPELIITQCEQFIQKYEASLDENEIVPVFWDCHFGNFLVKGKQIVGIIDLESVEYLSVDYTLDILTRMINYPHLYAPKEAEKYVVQKDYEPLRAMFRKYYPEVYRFSSIDKRIRLYALEYNFKILLRFPGDKEVVQRIGKLLEEKHSMF